MCNSTCVGLNMFLCTCFASCTCVAHVFLHKYACFCTFCYNHVHMSPHLHLHLLSKHVSCPCTRHVINMLYTKSYTNMHAFAFCYNHVHMSPHLHLHNCTCMYTHTSLSYCMLYMYTYDLHEIGMFWPRFWTRKCTSTGASTLLQLDTPMRKIRVLLQPCSHVSALVIAL